LATGSADSTVNLFDLRKLTTSLHTFSSHTYVLLSTYLFYIYSGISGSCFFVDAIYHLVFRLIVNTA